MHINGFQFGHLATRLFYKLVWAAIRYQLTGYPTLFTNKTNVIGVGAAYPNEQLWNEGYRVGKIGNLFGSTILMYEPPPTFIPAFTLALPIWKWEKAAREMPLAI